MTARTTIFTAMLSLTVSSAAPARADWLRATLGQPLNEVAHAVDLRVHDGVATFTVRRSFVNRGDRHDEASLRINLPYGAAATGLRIRSATGQWFDGELMEAERAAALYRELTGLGPHTPRDPALLQWVWADQLHLQVFPVPPHATSTVEYTLTVPTHYSAGRYVVSYPRPPDDGALASQVLRVFPEAERARVVVDGQVTAAGQPTVLGNPVVPVWFDEAHRPEPGASYVTSVVEVTRAGAVTRAEVELDIRHTYRGDLRVELIAPSGHWYRLVDRQGGGENDLRRRVKLPLAGRREQARGSWRLVVSDHARLDVGRVESWRLHLALAGSKQGGKAVRMTAAAADTPKFIPDAAEDGGAAVTRVEVAPPPISTVAARLGRVVAGKGKQFLRLEVDAAPQLRRKPRRPAVVFVVDASHSVGPEGIRGQLQLVRSFLGHLPAARAEVVLYRRRASRLLGRFVSPAGLEQALAASRAAGRLEPGNGSALDRGVRLALRLLAGRRAADRRYIVMLGDGLLRGRFHNGPTLRRLGAAAGPLVSHVALFRRGDSGTPAEERDDTHALSPLAARRGGVLLRLEGVPADPEQIKALDAITLGLVRPVRIDSFRVEGAVKLQQVPEALHEGSGMREMVAAPRTPRSVVLRGKIWARQFRRRVTVSPDFSRVTAAFVFSHDMHHELSRAEQLRVARLGRAVSPVTSYLAIEPGVRPSSAGIDRSAMGAGGAGYGAGGMMGARVRLAAARPSLARLMAAGVQRCVAAHRPTAGWSATLELETTYDEVVDVLLRSPGDAMGRCLVEEAWRLRLPGSYRQQRETFTLLLP